ncbi:MAG: TPP-binding protein, partial [Acidimicrobiales bacterium]|nr:TPP-binding protein [Acidimicrobiales bacterium]
FVVGSGAYDAGPAVTELAELVQAAVTTRRQGHGVVPTAHPLFVPITVAHELWPDADVVVGIGSRVEWPLGTWGFDDELTFISINLDPDELDRHGITAVGIHADADAACRALIAEIGTHPRRSRSAELAERRAWFDRVTAHLEPQRHYTAAIRAAVPPDGVLVEDVTQMGFACHLFYDHLAPRTFLTTGAGGTLGAATAQAIGASAATDKPVVALVGDGGFLFTATELATAVQHDIPCNIVVFNNNAYGNVRRIQANRFGPDRTIASTLRNPDFGLLARAFGVRYWKADSPESLTAALDHCIAFDGPGLVEVAVDPMPDPWPFLRMAPNRRGPTP